MRGGAGHPGLRTQTGKMCPTCQGIMQQLYDSKKGRKIWKCVTGCGAEEEIEVPEKAVVEPKGGNGLQSLSEYAGLTPVPDDSRSTGLQMIAPVLPPDYSPALVRPPRADPPRSPDLQDYEGPMLTKLRGLITQIGQLNDFKAEAERIHGALGVLGTRGVPDLPWKVAKAPRSQPAQKSKVEVLEPSKPGFQGVPLDQLVCQNCGRHFENKYQYKIGPGGKPVCKGHVCRPTQVLEG